MIACKLHDVIKTSFESNAYNALQSSIQTIPSRQQPGADVKDDPDPVIFKISISDGPRAHRIQLLRRFHLGHSIVVESAIRMISVLDLLVAI